MTIPPILLSPSRVSGRRRLTNKLIMIAAVMVVLQIPLWFIDSTRDERAARHDEAVGAVSDAWGGTQQVVGPVLVMPYQLKRGDEWIGADECEVWIFPETLEISGTLEPQELKRGIYRAQVYTADLKLSGRFNVRDDSSLPANRRILWDQARLVCVVSDTRGLRSEQQLQWGGEFVAWEAGSTFAGSPSGLHAPVTMGLAGDETFEIELRIDGSSLLEWVPLARSTRVDIASPWPTVGYRGAFLPLSREQSETGFQATWEVGHLGRDLPELWWRGALPDSGLVQRWAGSAFGVELIQKMEEYRTVERAIKYGILFMVTVFTGFFIFEFTGRRSLHVLNYLLVGGALCLFYLALLSLSEFLRFGWAYSWSAGAATALVVLYARAILGGSAAATKLAAMLVGIYGYLYFVLQLEELSLVSGTVLLFGLLAGVMYGTRHLQFDDGTAEEEIS